MNTILYKSNVVVVDAKKCLQIMGKKLTHNKQNLLLFDSYELAIHQQQ